MKNIVVLFMTMIMLCLASCVYETPPPDSHEPKREDQVSIVFVNVGKADSILLKINDRVYLIDAGEKESVPALFRALSIMDVERIDGLFLTHTHSDHIGGTEALVQRYQVAQLYSAEISQNNKKGENKIVQLAEKLGLAHTKLKVGDEIEVGENSSFHVIAPIVYNDVDDNDNSLVLLIEFNGKRFLFTGDMQFAEEKSILTSGVKIDSHVLKVGNHGNPDATSSSFAKAVSPEYAIISTDTTKDSDSANSLVIANLYPATILITQDYACGIKMDIDMDGIISVSDLQAVPATADLEVTGIDTVNQIITIKNNGQFVDLSEYFIVSERGSEMFVFQEGSTIEMGQTITIACKGGTGDFIWDDKNVWHKTKSDAGTLYDCNGNEISHRVTGIQ